MNNQNTTILAKTIYGEARGEYKNSGVNSLIAIGNVVMNRSLKSGKAIAEECLKNKQFSCWNKNDPNYKLLQNIGIGDKIYQICLDVASGIVNLEQEDITNGADHYYSRIMKAPPYWALEKNPTIVIGNHIFFRLGYSGQI